MKKASIIIICILFIIIGTLMFISAPYFADAKFIISNKTNNNISLLAKWRKNEKNIEIVKPNENIELSIHDEAAMELTVTLNENNKMKSQPLYCTSGMVIYIEIYPNKIMVGHGKPPNKAFNRDANQHAPLNQAQGIIVK